MADLEHGTWAGNSSLNAQNNPITTEFVTAMLKGRPNHMALMGADAQSDGPLQTMYDGPRPKVRAPTSQSNNSVAAGFNFQIADPQLLPRQANDDCMQSSC